MWGDCGKAGEAAGAPVAGPFRDKLTDHTAILGNDRPR